MYLGQQCMVSTVTITPDVYLHLFVFKNNIHYNTSHFNPRVFIHQCHRIFCAEKKVIDEDLKLQRKGWRLMSQSHLLQLPEDVQTSVDFIHVPGCE